MGGAIFSGIAADLLMRQVAWGIGATIWVGVVLATAWYLFHRWGSIKVELANVALFPLMGMALCYIWRDAMWLKFITSCSLVAGFVLSIHQAQGYELRSANAAPGLISTGLRAFLKTPRMLHASISWGDVKAGSNPDVFRSVVRGLLIGLPIFTVFALLLSSADAGFGHLLSKVFYFDLSDLPTRIFFVGLFTWLAAAFLYGSMRPLHDVKEKEAASSKTRNGLGMMEVGIVLGLVNILFGAFLVLQLGYLFGGSKFVSEVSGLTLSSYARQGFFELVLVTTMALAVLLTLNRHFKAEDEKHQRIFRALAGLQIGMLLLLLISAAQRMWLYTQSYGLTELRLYTSAFMVWIACVLLWFVWTVLRGNANLFARGAVQAGFVVVLGLYMVNPDALIARTNIERAIEGERLDAHYLSSLSADAVPVLVDALPRLSEADKRVVARALISRRETLLAADWRSWNGAHYTALKRIKSSTSDLDMALLVPSRLHSAGIPEMP